MKSLATPEKKKKNSGYAPDDKKYKEIYITD